MSLEQELLKEFGTATFSDKRVIGKGLGWAPKPDDRDYKLKDFIKPEREKGLQHWANPIQLNQGSEGACVGFGTTGIINAEPVVRSFDNSFARNLYYEARRNDEWPGESYEGTSARAGAQVAVAWGYFSAYAFTQSVDELAHYILNYGTAGIGVDWYSGMDRVDAEGYIHPAGTRRGGHYVIVDGVVWNMKGEQNRFRIRNSWGSIWGLNGRARITEWELEQLFSWGGSACMPVELAP